MKKRALAAALGLATAAPLLGGCGLLGAPDLVIYNAQHEELMTEIVPLFEEQTGLDVELRNGKDLELANQLVAEGDDSPADVFLTENSPAMSIVDNAGLFTGGLRGGARADPRASTSRLAELDRHPRPLHGRHVQHRPARPRRTCPPRSWSSPSRSGRTGSPSPPPAPTSRRS